MSDLNPDFRDSLESQGDDGSGRRTSWRWVVYEMCFGAFSKLVEGVLIGFGCLIAILYFLSDAPGICK